MYKAIIFDFDGMVAHGTRFSDAYVRDYGISMDDMAPFFNDIFPKCLIGKADLKEELEKGWLEKWKWKRSADELLQYWFATGADLDQSVLDIITELHKKGIVCVLTTNQEKYRTDYIINDLGCGRIFDRVFSSTFIGAKKPEQKFLDTVMEYLTDTHGPMEKSDVLFWDDRAEFVAGAQEYGIDARLYTNISDLQSIL